MALCIISIEVFNQLIFIEKNNKVKKSGDIGCFSKSMSV